MANEKMVIYRTGILGRLRYHTEPPLDGMEGGRIGDEFGIFKRVTRALDRGYEIEMATKRIPGIGVKPVPEKCASFVNGIIERYEGFPSDSGNAGTTVTIPGEDRELAPPIEDGDKKMVIYRGIFGLLQYRTEPPLDGMDKGQLMCHHHIVECIERATGSGYRIVPVRKGDGDIYRGWRPLSERDMHRINLIQQKIKQQALPGPDAAV